MLLMDLESLLTRPVPTVQAEDMHRMWELVKRLQPHGQVMGLGEDVLAQTCPTCSDLSALWGRTALVYFVGKYLDTQRDQQPIQNTPDFGLLLERMATYPLPNGLQGFDAADFLHQTQPE